MTENKTGTKLGKKKKVEVNSIEINELNITNPTDKFDWDFKLDRQWSRTKK
ncbi:MAG: hypothetical protein KGD61_07105 [Candidatus Lokiarchaeota archaeon]|nr:hypothetical protein [Candidatus Lokiarchaeota archaeon]